MNVQRQNLGVPDRSGTQCVRRTATRRGLVLGDDAAAGASTRGAQAAEIVATALPVAKAIFDTDAAEDVETLRAKIKNHKRMRDSLPEPLKTIYANKVRVLEAKYRAATQKHTREKQLAVSRKEWAGLGKATVVVGIGVGASIIALLLSMTMRRGKS